MMGRYGRLCQMVGEKRCRMFGWGDKKERLNVVVLRVWTDGELSQAT
jgi:hypothetical protein